MRHLFEGSHYSDSLFVKCGINSRVATKRGAASIQANTYGKYSKKLGFHYCVVFSATNAQDGSGTKYVRAGCMV